MPDIERDKVLVLLAAYNGEKWIKAQVDSILKQRNVTVRVLIRDDFSRDATLLVLKELYSNNSCVTLIESEKASGSSGAAFYNLFSIADLGEYSYIALSDQDDIWFPEKLERAIAILKRSGSSGYSCAVRAFWENGKEVQLSQNCASKKFDFLFEGAGQGCTYVLTSAFFKKIQEFLGKEEKACRAMHYHDWCIYLLARTWGYRWYFDDRPCMFYRQHSSNEIGGRGNLLGVCRRLALIRSGWYKKQIIISRNLFLVAGSSKPDLRELAISLTPRNAIDVWNKYMVILFHSRRRLLDRFVLFVSAIIGWI